MKKLLIVDDEESILLGMRLFLTRRGFAVDCAREREEAEAMVANGHYHCVIADLCLTSGRGPDGLEIISSVKECSPGTRIVIVTAYGSGDTGIVARKLGADALLHKPAPMDELARVVEGLVGGLVGA